MKKAMVKGTLAANKPTGPNDVEMAPASDQVEFLIELKQEEGGLTNSDTDLELDGDDAEQNKDLHDPRHRAY